MAKNSPVRAPASLYIVVGVLAAFGALMLVRMIIGMLFSLVTIAVIVGLIVLVVSALGRRGSR
ncbi:MAG: hypothetical protein IT196_09170 [Acidimicrobiales bacterium]|nr:hypothetical protein [Acidimicrobiales bacterium]